MPNLVTAKKANFSSKKKPAEDGEDVKVKEPEKPKTPSGPKSSKARAASLIKGTKEEKYTPDWDDSDDDDDDDDDIIQGSIDEKASGKVSMAGYVIAGVVVVILVVAAFLIFGRAKNQAETPATPAQPTEQTTPTAPTGPGDPAVGTQNFLGNTNNVSDSPLTDPNNFIKDIFGLTLQTNYEVAEIQSAADFVSYTKYRGTWGGGLELYWLAAEYKGYSYSIQVPFEYYKELDDTGIVPVKMEVLRIKSDSSDEYLTVISYMRLDEETLRQVLKSQRK